LTRVDTRELAHRLRGHALRMTHRARASHIGSCLSVADILAVLYGAVLQLDSARLGRPDRDRLIVSKGHAAAIVYAALGEWYKAFANKRNTPHFMSEQIGRHFSLRHARPAGGTVGDSANAD
jgi:transketolase N-terminal domain/subunit